MPQVPRLFVDLRLMQGDEPLLPAGQARHVQVLRLQPGDGLALFNGLGAAHHATVLRMGRSEVQVRVGELIEPDAALTAWMQRMPHVTLAVGMPANERMDWLVEKATELGVAAIAPLIAERSVLRMRGERADKKLAHWQGVAAAASEQCGRWTVPQIEAVRSTTEFFRQLSSGGDKAVYKRRWVLSLASDAQPLQRAAAGLWAGSSVADLLCLSGPEGGLTPAEELAARDAGFTPVGLGPLTLRADTAPVAVLAALGCLPNPPA